MTQQKETRDLSLDLIRALAIVMVVVIHVTSIKLSLPVDSADWWGALFWGSISRPAVPLFFLCSGALMMGRDIPVKRLILHNCGRVAIAMVVWSMIYKLSPFLHGGLTMAVVLQALKETLVLKQTEHFYYMHILFLVYAFQPVARTFLRQAKKREVEYFLLVWAVTGILFPLLRHFWPFILVDPIEGWYAMKLSYAAIGFGILGWYLKQYGASIQAGWYALSWAVGLLITFGGTAVLSQRAGSFSDLFLGGMTPGPALMTFGIFGLMTYKKSWSAPIRRVGSRLARASFCIYLCHVLFLWKLWGMAITAASPTLLVIPATALAVIIPSWLVWEVLRHIPVVNRYLI